MQILKRTLTQDDICIHPMQERLPDDAATSVVVKLMQLPAEAKRRAGRRSKVVDTLWAVGGLNVTGASYAQRRVQVTRTSSLRAAVVFGLVQSVRGLIQTRRSTPQRSPGRVALTAAQSASSGPAPLTITAHITRKLPN